MGTSPKSSEPAYLHYITVQYITLRYSTLHYLAVKYSTLHYTTVHYITLQYITVNNIIYIDAQDLVHIIVCHQRGRGIFHKS